VCTIKQNQSCRSRQGDGTVPLTLPVVKIQTANNNQLPNNTPKLRQNTYMDETENPSYL